MRAVYLIPVAFAALIVLLGAYLFEIGSGERNVSEVPSALIGKPAPDFALPPIQGMAGGFRRTDLKGQVSLVNVFASWCIPCRAEMPVLERLRDEGIAVYGIDVKDKPEAARDFLERYGNPYHAIGADVAGRVSIDWGVYGYPETFVVDRTGTIRYKHIGPIMPFEVDEKFLPLLKDLAG